VNRIQNQNLKKTACFKPDGTHYILLVHPADRAETVASLTESKPDVLG
jgi:hypothetical protein